MVLLQILLLNFSLELDDVLPEMHLQVFVCHYLSIGPNVEYLPLRSLIFLVSFGMSRVITTTPLLLDNRLSNIHILYLSEDSKMISYFFSVLRKHGIIRKYLELFLVLQLSLLASNIMEFTLLTFLF